MRKIADKVGATVISSTWRILPDWWQAECIDSPVPHAHITTTTTHKTLRGPRAGLII